MPKERKPSKLRQKINKLCEENEFFSIQQNRNRARSITVGTAFGGITEINIRTDAGSMYAQMQPTEVVELIEQLASGIGIEIVMRPKQNFASWRGWEEIIEQRIGFDKIAWKGAAVWQLNGDAIEENYQNKMSLLEEEKVDIKQLEPEINSKSSVEKKSIRKSTPRKQKTVKENTNE
jgi:hypothetical protein